MAAARVLDVGNCDPDHSSVRGMLQREFDADVDRVMFVREALEALSRRPYDLVLVNRLIFADGSDGSELIRAIKADERLAGTPIMLVSNFADAQERAVRDGAVPGFGKAALRDPQTHARLAKFLPRVQASAVRT